MKEVKRTRKPKYDKPLVNLSVKLRRDQLEFLKDRENTSEWVRDAIDKQIEAEGGQIGATDIIAMTKRVTFLKQRISQLTKAEEYVKAQDMERISREHIEEYRMMLSEGAEMSLHANGQLYIKKEDGFPVGGFDLADGLCPGWTLDEMYHFIRLKKVESSSDDYHRTIYKFPLEITSEILDRVEKNIPLIQKTIESYEQRIAQLQTQIEKLGQKINQ